MIKYIQDMSTEEALEIRPLIDQGKATPLVDSSGQVYAWLIDEPEDLEEDQENYYDKYPHENSSDNNFNPNN